MEISRKKLFEVMKANVKLKYPFKTTNGRSFALIISQDNYTNVVWDVNVFRPDPRDYDDFLAELNSKSGSNVIVVYENVKYVNIPTLIPRYVVWNNISFVNIR